MELKLTLTYEETCCRWAEKKYDLKNVSEVGFDSEFDEGFAYSEYTIEPGSAYVEVQVVFGDNRKTKFFREADLSTVIKEVVTFNG